MFRKNKPWRFLAGCVVGAAFAIQPCVAQDSLFMANLQHNIAQLEQNTWDTDSVFTATDFNTEVPANFEKAFGENKPVIFPELLSESSACYHALKSLSEKEKKHLFFAFANFEQNAAQELSAQDLPADLKYLAPALSMMNNRAVDEPYRAGIWLLNHFQAKAAGLQMTKLRDDRFDDVLATGAAVQQLAANQDIFPSTELAVLGYLAGNAAVKNSLQRGAKNWKEVLAELPEKVTFQVANFQAMTVFLAGNGARELKVQDVDTVTVSRQIHLQQVAQVLQIPLAELWALNPGLRYGIVAAENKKDEMLLPKGCKTDFILQFDSIYHAGDSSLFAVINQKIEYAPAPSRQYAGERVSDLHIEGKVKIKYTLQRGDVLGFIAEEYNVRVADLKYWNNIYNERRIQAGKQILIFVDKEHADYYRGLQKLKKPQQTAAATAKAPVKKVIPASAKKVEHVVKNGESPYVIAKKYKGVSPEDILEWNGISNARKIQVGQKLIIYLLQ